MGLREERAIASHVRKATDGPRYASHAIARDGRTMKGAETSNVVVAAKLNVVSVQALKVNVKYG